MPDEFVYLVGLDEAPWNVLTTVDERDAERAARELADVVGRDHVKLTAHRLGENSWWADYLANLKLLEPARQAARPRIRLLERLGAAACLLWPDARYPAAEDARDRLSAVFADIQFELCDTFDSVGNEDVVWVVRHGPAHAWPWPEDPRAKIRLILASGRPRPESVLVWMHTAADQHDPFAYWHTLDE